MGFSRKLCHSSSTLLSKVIPQTLPHMTRRPFLTVPEGSRGQIASFLGSFPENGYEAVYMSSIRILLVF